MWLDGCVIMDMAIDFFLCLKMLKKSLTNIGNHGGNNCVVLDDIEGC